jgi:uncharacterized protein with PIN domain
LRRKTDAQFKQEVYSLVGDEYTFLDSYVNAKTKLRAKHNKCGNVYEVRPNDFLNGKRCPFCAKLNIKNKLIKTDAQFRQDAKNEVGTEYTFLDEYINSSTKIKVKHNTCGHTYKVEPNSFLQGKRCPYCYGNVKKTDAQFKKEVFDLVGDEYTFLDEYANTHTKLRVKHNKCGNVYGVRPHDFFRGNRCPYCSGKMKKTDAQFKQEVQKLVGGEYDFLDTYADSKTKIRVKHNKCGNIYEVQPSNFLQGYRCPYCSNSKGELIISKILESLNVNYEYQKTFDDLKDINPLSYDFFIPDQNILIEYQGIQHYEPVDHFGGKKRFPIQQKHDKMKGAYAKAKGYKLITVPYTADTFSKIKKYLIKHGLN